MQLWRDLEAVRELAVGKAFGVVESVKAVSDLNMPIAGEVVARNDALEQSSELVNHSQFRDSDTQ